ncbi:MAG: hydrogenase expression/formation protein HypE [Planctomycetota bacterium]|jgi:hydrogenase expression/formation protein HypE
MTGAGKDRIVLAHGGGGELTRRLLEERVLPRLSNDLLDPLFDSAILPAVKGRLCLTTDAFVVQPLEFPGGDIGRLAVCGTVNDLAVMGARPVALSLALVMEEGLSFDMLDRIVTSIAAAAEEAGVPIATGDTKVVERSRGDGLTITTAGVGELSEETRLEPGRIEPGDGIIISGRIAEHGLAVMAAREELNIATEIESDAAPLDGLVNTLLDAGGDVKFLRDPTRGGVAGVVADLVEDTGLGLEIEEERLPLSAACRHTCELLGLDPLTVANEGKIMAVVGEKDIEQALEALRAHPLGKEAKCVGRMLAEDLPLAELITAIGGRRIIQRPYGEELPRIC